MADDEYDAAQGQKDANKDILQPNMKSCENTFETEEDDEESVDCLDVVRYGNHPSCKNIDDNPEGSVHSKSEPVDDRDDDFTPDFPEPDRI